MNITIVSVVVENITQGSKAYRKIAVAYRDHTGTLREKKLTDFSVKQGGVDLLINAATGDQLEITIVKNGDYSNWESIKLVAGSGASGQTQAPQTFLHHKGECPAPAKAGLSSYPTKEERNATQLMIVRQSSISSAVSLMKTEKIVPSIQQVLEVARAFEDYVMSTGMPVAKASFEDFESDVPE